jgi:hypothetical protein
MNRSSRRRIPHRGRRSRRSMNRSSNQFPTQTSLNRNSSRRNQGPSSSRNSKRRRSSRFAQSSSHWLLDRHLSEWLELSRCRTPPVPYRRSSMPPSIRKQAAVDWTWTFCLPAIVRAIRPFGTGYAAAPQEGRRAFTPVCEIWLFDAKDSSTYPVRMSGVRSIPIAAHNSWCVFNGLCGLYAFCTQCSFALRSR